MKIVFKKVEIHNFMSFADEIIDFDDFRGMTRIKGYNYDGNCLNGSGKTTIINSIVYGLYGQLPFKLKNENIYNRHLKDHNTKVTIFFDSNRKHYKVVTGFRSRQSYCELYEITDGNENNITKSTIAETRLFIEKELLHCDINLFMRTIILNSDDDLNFFRLKAADKKEFIDKLFDISMFGDIYNRIHRDILVMEKDILSHQSKMIVLNKSSEEYKNRISQFDENREKMIAELTENIEQSEEILNKRKSTALKKNDELVSKCENAIDKLSDTINSKQTDIQNLEFSNSDCNQKIRNITAQINDRQKIIDKHSEIHSKLCDDCKEIFSDYYNLKKYKNEIDTLKNKICGLNEKITSNNEKVGKIKNEKTELVKKQNELSSKLRKINSDYDNEQNEIRRSEIALNTLKSRLENEKNSSNPYLELLNSNEENIKIENDELEKLNEKYKYVKFSESIVSQDNIKKFIIKDLIGILNNRIKYYLHKLGAGYDIVFNENMEYDFITDVKEGIEFNNFSKGERARISIATCFAFRDFLSTRSNISSNIFILDEFFDGNVDPMALEHITDILKDFTKTNKQKIFVVSHRQEISDEIFDSIITVEKRNNISKMKISV